MNTDFPEDIFTTSSNIPLYKYKLEQGNDICKTKTILFCGIGRNIGANLDLNIQRLHRTGSMFKSYKIFIYENDSSDKTIEILQKNRSNSLIFLSEHREDQDYLSKIESGEDTWHHNRCIVLSECRNKYLSYIESLDQKFDYICVLDLDLCGGWSYDGIKHGIFTLESDKSYAAATSYGILADKFNTLDLEGTSKNEYVLLKP
jgi:hypothetical protein